MKIQSVPWVRVGAALCWQKDPPLTETLESQRWPLMDRWSGHTTPPGLCTSFTFLSLSILLEKKRGVAMKIYSNISAPREEVSPAVVLHEWWSSSRDGRGRDNSRRGVAAGSQASFSEVSTTVFKDSTCRRVNGEDCTHSTLVTLPAILKSTRCIMELFTVLLGFIVFRYTQWMLCMLNIWMVSPCIVFLNDLICLISLIVYQKTHRFFAGF